MPEFILDRGTSESAAQFARLDAFTRGYIEAAFFTEEERLREELQNFHDDASDCSASLAELAPETLSEFVRDCAMFQEANRADLDEATDSGRIVGYDEASAGRDFWYTRNGHGVGYWDRNELPDPLSARLTAAAQLQGQVDLYVGDDGLIYSM